MRQPADPKHISLTPVIHSWIRQLIPRKNLLFEKIQREGSPLNIHCLEPFRENLKAYGDIFEKYKIKHKIYFARKANKCMAFAQQSSLSGHGVDTASYRELKQCLEAGIPSGCLILTAAVKNRKLMELAVENEVTIVLDNHDEYELLNNIANEKQRNASFNIRLGGFDLSFKKLYSRFGFSTPEAFKLITEKTKENAWLHYTGLHFHLNGYSIEERALAIEQCILFIDQLKQKGVPTHSLDIGGGFLVNYLSDKTQWETFQRELKEAVLEKRPPLTYQNDALGMVKIGDRLYGEPTVYPYYNEIHKEKFLEAVLTTFSEAYLKPVYELIRERNLELRIEPGRSLLDQAGVTVATVIFRKNDSEGNLLIGLEMNRTQLRSSSADFLLDPIHLPANDSDESVQGICYGYLVGSYCLEQELILKRKIKFERFPQIGDLIVFPNTAGYMMHFFESEAHLFELAKNVFYDAEKRQISPT